MEQLTLQPVARHSDPITSHQAAALASLKANSNRARCYEALWRAAKNDWRNDWDGLTDFELADLTGLQQTSAGKRRLELVRLGLVEATPHTRPAPSGAPARVWRVTTQ